MKKLLSSLTALLFFLYGFSQNLSAKYPFKKRSVLAVHFTLHDFQTAADLEARGLSAVLSEKQWSKTSRMDPGFAFSYSKGLTDHIDVMARLGFSFLRYPIPGKTVSSSDKVLIESDVNLNLKMTSDKYWVSPYLSIGAGASQYNKYYAAYIPVGMGLQVNFFDETFLFVTANYRLPVTSFAENHLFYGIGLGGYYWT
jgi:OmpA-OmpF porin, OOP family